MNKILLLLLSASVCMNVYLVNVEVVVKDELDQEAAEPARDRISLAQAAIQKKTKGASKNPLEKNDKNCEPEIVEKVVYRDRSFANEPEELERGQFDENDYKRLSERYGRSWQRESQNFFDYRLGLTPTQQEDYQKLKTSRESELAALIEKKKESDKGTLPDGSFILSPEEMIEMGKINQKYTAKLKNLFGQNAYQEYLSFREEFNRKIARESENGTIFSVQF